MKINKQTCLARNVRFERRQDYGIGWRFGNNACDALFLRNWELTPKALSVALGRKAV